MLHQIEEKHHDATQLNCNNKNNNNNKNFNVGMNNLFKNRKQKSPEVDLAHRRKEGRKGNERKKNEIQN